jgi:hypothetical protein
MGKVKPLTPNSAELVEAEDRVTLAPVAVRVAVKLLLAPTATLPKLELEGERESCPVVVAEAERGMVKLASEAVEIMVNVPATAPLACG